MVGPRVRSLLGADTSLVPDTLAPHSSPTTAESLPAAGSTAILGTLSSPAAPGVFRVPLTATDGSVVIGFSWVRPSDRVAGNLVLLNSAADVVWSHTLPGRPVAIDLEFSHVSAAPGTALYVEIVPEVHSAVSPAARSSEFVLQVLRFPEPMSFTSGAGGTGLRPVESPGFGPNSNGPAPSFGTVPVNDPDRSPGVVLPLPQSAPLPVGGIFAIGEPHVEAGVVGGVSVNLDMFDHVPAQTRLPVAAARSFLASVPGPSDDEGAEAFRAALEELTADGEAPFTLDAIAPWVVDRVVNPARAARLSAGEESAGLIHALPPVGIRALGGILEQTAGAARVGDRAGPLPAASSTERGVADWSTAVIPPDRGDHD